MHLNQLVHTPQDLNTLIFINSQSCFNFCSNKIQLSLHDSFERFTFPILFILFCHIFSEHLAYRFSPANRLLGFHLFNNSNACIKCTYGIFTGSNIPFSFSLFIARQFSRKVHRDNTCLLPSVVQPCASASPAPSLLPPHHCSSSLGWKRWPLSKAWWHRGLGLPGSMALRQAWISHTVAAGLFRCTCSAGREIKGMVAMLTCSHGKVLSLGSSPPFSPPPPWHLPARYSHSCENNLKKQQNNGVALGAPIPHRESAPADHSYRGLWHEDRAEEHSPGDGDFPSHMAAHFLSVLWTVFIIFVFLSFP